MTVRHLKIFISVFRTANVTRAAEQLHMTQPAVSRAIQELEKYYGIRLFDRINRRLSPTETGRQFYANALHIVESFDRMDRSLKNWDEFGILRVGATPTLASVILPGVVRQYKIQYPGIQVQAKVFNGSRLQTMLLNNDLDFALIEGSDPAPHLQREVIGEDRLILILPPNDSRSTVKRLRLQDLANDPLLLRESGSMARSFLDRTFARHGFSVSPDMESSSTHALIQAVHAGLGISFLPEQLVLHSIESGFVSSRRVDDESFIRQDYIVRHENKFLTDSGREFLELCRAAGSGTAVISDAVSK